MIDVKMWKKYRAQIDLYNKIKIDDCERVNKKMRENHNRRYALKRAQYLRSGSIGFMPMPTMCGFCIPILKTASVEGCLDWMADGCKPFAKKLKVKKS